MRSHLPDSADVLIAGALVVLFGPMLTRDLVFPQRDAGFSSAQMAWLQDAVLGRVALWEAPLGAPLELGTTRADWVLAQALATLPFASLPPERVWVYASLAGVLGSVLVLRWAARALLGPGPHVAIAVVAGAAGPAVIGHLQHANLVWHGAWVLAGALVLGGRPFWAGLVAMLAAHAGIYTAVHAVVVAGILVLARPRDLPRLVAGAALGALTLVPVVLKYREAAARYGWETEKVQDVVDVAQILAPIGGAPLHLWIFGKMPPVADPPLPGYGLALVGIVGLGLAARRREWWPILAATVATAALALGPSVLWRGHPVAPAPGALLALLDDDLLRGPARWVAVSHVGLALGAAFAVSRLRRARLVATLVVLGLLYAETPRPSMINRPRWPPELLAALEAAPPGPLLDRPGRDGCGDARFSVALSSGRALIGGNYARYSPALREVNEHALAWPEPESRRWLARSGGAVVVEHPPFRGTKAEGCEVVARHRLCVVPGG